MRKKRKSRSTVQPCICWQLWRQLCCMKFSYLMRFLKCSMLPNLILSPRVFQGKKGIVKLTKAREPSSGKEHQFVFIVQKSLQTRAATWTNPLMWECRLSLSCLLGCISWSLLNENAQVGSILFFILV